MEVLGQPEAALNCYNQALAIEPQNVHAWYNKGNALDMLGRPEEALSCYDQALAIDQYYVKAWYNKGNVLYALGSFRMAQPQDAADAYRRFIELAPAEFARLVEIARQKLKLLEQA